MDFPGKSIGVGSHSLLQGILPTQGWNLVSCIAGRFFTIWATREVLSVFRYYKNSVVVEEETEVHWCLPPQASIWQSLLLSVEWVACKDFCHGGGSQEPSWWPVLGGAWAGSRAVDMGAGGSMWLEMAKEIISELKYITTEIIQSEIGVKWLKENRWSYRDLWVDKTFSKMCSNKMVE